MDVPIIGTVESTATGDVLRLCKEDQDLLFREARTANTFSDEQVTDEQVRAIYDLVKWAPTSMNQQPMRVLLVRSEEGRQRLLQYLMGRNRLRSASAPLVAILAMDTEFHRHLPRLFPRAPQMKDSFAADDTDRHCNALLNSALQVAYFILGVRSAGLAAGPMTGFDAEGLNAEFFPEGTIKSVVVVNIGKPGENAWFERLPRLAYHEVVSVI
jgi:3-hydroxypropanoate dehydrogenase